MGTREECGLKPGDIATTVQAVVKSDRLIQTVSLEPDATWENAAYTSGPDTPVVYEVTVYEVTEINDNSTFGTVIATNTDKQLGSKSRVSGVFKNYVGGESDHTSEALRNAGVSIHQVLDMKEDGTPVPGIQVVYPWRSLGEYTNRDALKQIEPTRTAADTPIRPQRRLPR